MRHLTSQKQVPLDILGAAIAYRLGIPEKVFETRGEPLIFRFIGFASLFIGCLIILIFIVAYGQLFSWWLLWQALFIPLIGVSWFIFGGWVLLAPHVYPQPHVYMCPEGLIFISDKLEVVRWDQLERLWQESDGKAQGRRRYIVRRSDETLLSFGSELAGVEYLVKAIEQELTRRLLPRALAAYRVGANVSFDEIVVSKRGLRLSASKRMLLWENLGELVIDPQNIIVHEQHLSKPAARIKAFRVPNMHILRQLVAYARQERALSAKPYVAAYISGRPLSFGKLRISQQGIQIEQEQPVTLPWQEIGAIGIGASELMIARQREQQTYEWYVVSLWEITNLEQLRDVVAYVLQNGPR
ncbi:DUF6585 family protein [Ktedonospora formicarum]|uniref:Uncharacterized protein n=1 Tax=Ktedonospora formicarum TaxID=2778364 RepID=A0A8J3I0D1_9CHLR|nr:DUF6585 family protein [Ktedonospora formicarum]GHO44490.1 hypothetical protein KSX_26530 [Ktedonospora formicarum]